ncbi:unnamed protein product [Symbiodinium sp. CCMP2592]|nr:unnamed protein product [Symbiodinium sp. CCMP2592]
MVVHTESFSPTAPEPQTLCFEIGVLVQEGRQQPTAGIGTVSWSCAHAVDPRAATLCAYAAGFLAIVAEGHEACRQVLGSAELTCQSVDMISDGLACCTRQEALWC